MLGFFGLEKRKKDDVGEDVCSGFANFKSPSGWRICDSLDMGQGLDLAEPVSIGQREEAT